MINRRLPWYKRAYWTCVLEVMIWTSLFNNFIKKRIITPYRLHRARRNHPEIVTIAKALSKK